MPTSADDTVPQVAPPNPPRHHFNHSPINSLSNLRCAFVPLGTALHLLSSKRSSTVQKISLIAFSVVVLLLHGFSQNSPAKPGSIQGEVFAKTQNGEPAVLPHARIVLRGPVNKEVQSDAQGAFAVESLPPGMYEIEANAPGLNAALTVEVHPG